MPRNSNITVDINTKIATKISHLRLTSGLSRQELAKQVGVTHQQIKKYEDGSNRITIARLVLISKALKHPVSYFLDNYEEELPSDHKRMCIEVSRNFLNIKEPKHRKAIHDLVKAFAANK